MKRIELEVGERAKLSILSDLPDGVSIASVKWDTSATCAQSKETGKPNELIIVGTHPGQTFIQALVTAIGAGMELTGVVMTEIVVLPRDEEPFSIQLVALDENEKEMLLQPEISLTERLAEAKRIIEVRDAQIIDLKAALDARQEDVNVHDDDSASAPEISTADAEDSVENDSGAEIRADESSDVKGAAGDVSDADGSRNESAVGAEIEAAFETVAATLAGQPDPEQSKDDRAA